MEVFGLPLHPLVVHGAVVLVPLACLGALVVVPWQAARRHYGWLTAAFAVAGAAAAVVARVSGEALFAQIGGSPAAAAHHTWGTWAPFPAVLLAVALTTLLVMDRRGAGGFSSLLHRGVAAVTLLAALAGLVLIVITGHTGATAVWG